MPSEAEWEYACRAGTTTRFYWGDDLNESQIVDYAWYNKNSDETSPAGQKIPNAWGLYDMCGNVREWCEDWYHVSYTGAPTDGSPWVSPAGTRRVNRGGSYYDIDNLCRSAYRNSNEPTFKYPSTGFRILM